MNVKVKLKKEEEEKGIKRGGVMKVVSKDVEMIVKENEIKEEIEIEMRGIEIGE